MTLDRNNIAYWITDDFLAEVPHSEAWTNDLYAVNPLSFGDALDSLLKNFKRDKPVHYAIVTDISDVFVKVLAEKFISNNIIKIDKATYEPEKVKKQISWIMSDFGREQLMDNKVFFWSDPHFNHRNIISYCNRPWNSGKDSLGNIIVTDEDVNSMNEALIANFNSVVPEDGTTWCLGDFCLGPEQDKRIPEFVSRLNGKVNLVMGNHDRHSVKFYYDAGFNRVYDRKVIINDFVILSHEPLEFLNENCPFFSIYGHVHNSTNYSTFTRNSCCACVERHGYKPISMQQVKAQCADPNV